MAGYGWEADVRVNVMGTMRTNSDGERYIEATEVSPAGAGSVEPLALVNRSLGGGDRSYDPATGAGQKGLAGGAGLNNIGLLIATVGCVTYQEAGFLYIDDGSALDDGSGHRGVKLPIEGDAPPDLVGKYVKVVGISSCFKVGDDLYPLMLVTEGELIE